jgi:peroxiredoxin Q/BCP
MKCLAAFSIASLLLAHSAWAAAPEVGDKAPDFQLQASDGKEYSLSQFRGRQAVVIAWFPKAFTGGCTAECKSMKADGAAIRAFDVAYFTASVDDNGKNTDFAKSLELDFPILSDPGKATAKAYGVVHEGRAVAERWTFYIDTDGIIRAIDKKVDTKGHAHQIARQLEAIGVKKK